VFASIETIVRGVSSAYLTSNSSASDDMRCYRESDAVFHLGGN
jgi:hypothetical protein